MAYISKFTGAQIDDLLEKSKTMGATVDGLAQDVAAKEDTANKVTSLDNPNDVTFPTSKAVWDWIEKGYQFRGVATPATNPGIPDGPVFYLATEAGVYSNFNNIEVTEGEASILQWSNGAWSKKRTGCASQD